MTFGNGRIGILDAGTGIRFAAQMHRDYFPVSLDKMGADLTFWQAEHTDFTTPSGVHIKAARHNHPGGAYSYRITEGSTTLVYCADVEHVDGIDPTIVDLARYADLLIHDTQYTPDELKEKRGWGHSSWEQALEVALQAKVKKLALFHHDPEHNDAFLLNVEKECQRIFSEAFLAREGVAASIPIDSIRSMVMYKSKLLPGRERLRRCTGGEGPKGIIGRE